MKKRFFGIHFRKMNKTDDDICAELDRSILAGASQTEAARRLWLDGIKYRQQKRKGKA